MGDNPHMESIVHNAACFVGANYQQFTPGYESVASLVKMKESFSHRLESNTRDLYLYLKICHVLVQHYRLVSVKLDEACIEEEAEASTAAKMRTNNHTTSSHNTYVPWWRKKPQRSGRGHGQKRSSHISSSTLSPAPPSSQRHFQLAKRVYAPFFRIVCVFKLGEHLMRGGKPALARCTFVRSTSQHTLSSA